MSKENEFLVHALDRLKHINFEDDHLTNDLIQTIQKYLAQPEQEPIFQKAYYDDEISDLMVDFYDNLNADECGIPVDKNGFCEGIFEVSINWRKQ